MRKTEYSVNGQLKLNCFEITKKGGFPRRSITYKTIQNTDGKTLAEIKDYSIEEGGLGVSINKSISDIHCYEDFFVVCTRTEQTTMSDQTVFHSFLAMEYNGSPILMADTNWNPETCMCKVLDLLDEDCKQ